MTDNRETIIRLAGIAQPTYTPDTETVDGALVGIEAIERFAQLVLDDYIQNRMPVLVARAQKRATVEEKARCISDCEILLGQAEAMAGWGDPFDLGRAAGQEQCIAAIRAGSA